MTEQTPAKTQAIDAPTPYEDQVTTLRDTFVANYNAALAAGGNADLLTHALMAAGIEAATHNYGPGPAVDWLRRLADDLASQYPADATRH